MSIMIIFILLDCKAGTEKLSNQISGITQRNSAPGLFYDKSPDCTKLSLALSVLKTLVTREYHNRQ